MLHRAQCHAGKIKHKRTFCYFWAECDGEVIDFEVIAVHRLHGIGACQVAINVQHLQQQFKGLECMG